MPQPVIWGSTYSNAYTSLIALTNGNLLQVWGAPSLSGNSNDVNDIFIQVVDAEGNPLSDQITVNPVIAGYQAWDIGNVAAPLANGGFVVLYSDLYSIEYNIPDNAIHAQVYDANGVAVGAPIAVAPDVNNIYSDFDISATADGGFVVAWDVVTDLNTFDADSYLRVFDSAGAPVSAAINLSGGAAGVEAAPSIAVLTSGDIAVSYITNTGTVVEVYSPTGVLRAGEGATITPTSVGDFPYANGFSVVALTGGGFVVTYTDAARDPTTHVFFGNVYSQIFDASGHTVGAPILVSTSAHNALNAEAVALPDGGFFVAWHDNDPATSADAIYGARFTSAGAADGGQFVVQAADTGHNVFFANLTLTDDGRIAMVMGDLTLAGGFQSNSILFLDPHASGQTFNGTSAYDAIAGTVFNDTINGLGGDDLLTGGPGVDTVNGGDGSDTLTGGAFSDVNGHDVLDGGAGADFVYGGAAAETLSGGDGDDFISGNGGADLIDGGAGIDGTTLYRADLLSTDPFTFTLTGDVMTPDGAHLLSIEQLYFFGAAGVDSVSGGSGGDTMFGYAGGDVFSGAGGADTLTGDAGNDTLNGDAGNDTLSGGDGDDTVNGGDGDDLIDLGAGNDVAHGDAGNDSINAGDGADSVDGGAGDDFIVASGGDDTVVSGAGVDTVSGGTGNDTYRVAGTGGSVQIIDTFGNDTLDFTGALGPANIDLRDGQTSTADGRAVTIQGSLSALPLDFVLLQDLSGSFDDDIATVQALAPNLIASIQSASSNAWFGLTSFVDIPTDPFGAFASGDYAYHTDLALTANSADWQTTLDGLQIYYGGDTPEAQLIGLLQLGLRGPEVGYRADSLRVVVIATDAAPHMAGDNPDFGPNNGDAVLDGFPPATGEDYPTIVQVAAALGNADIIPIFAVTADVVADYQNLVAQLGFGFVVTLSSDSSDIITAIETGLGSFSESSVENAIGTAFADTILGNALDNTLDGAAGADTMTGGAGNDTYLVDNAGDVVVEDAVAFSYDGVVSSAANYTLALNVESLQLALSAGDINGTGNAQNNDIYGNDGHNVLNGGDGDDYVGGDTTEIIGVSDTVHGGAGNDTVDGWGGADQVFGDEGDDVVEAWGSEYTAGELSDGGAGTDTLRLYALETVNTIDLSIGTVLNFERLEFGSFSGSLTVSTTGAQALSGFAANTVVAGSGATDTLIINNATTLNLSGWTVANWTAGVDTITINGTSAANNITGTGAGDWINGGVGADTMNGAGGDDTFVVDNAGDVVTEALNAGTDTVRSLLSFTLGANVENLIITGVGGLSGTGNNLNNVITGNAGGNTLDGKAGADTMIGGLGNDIYLVDNAGDVVTENVGEGTDTIRSTVGIGTLAANVENLELQATAITGNGNELNNRITGNASANNINGGVGADTMLGGLGNDTYFVDNIGDVVNEASGEGTDTIFSTINIALLATNVENLSLNGVAAVTATGNALNNVITGNSTNNVLNGGAGEDTLNGGLGNDNYVVNSAGDVVNDTGGNADTITSFIDMATLTANIENLTLAGTALIGGGNGLNNVIVGNSLANTLSGGAGNDQLNGGVGADTMSGGLGDDSYLVENAGDVVTENSGEGSDTVYAFINITLAANVEKLNLMPQGGAINGTANGLDNRLNGNDFDNVLTALGGNDVIQGLGGADHIIGGAGQDNIFGGSGNDVFVYQTTSDSGTTGATRDLINDFVQGQDHIDLSAIDAISGGGDDAFSFIGAGAFSHVAGQLRFEFVDAVGTANDYTIISMDVNGDAAADSQIALRGLVMLTGADFVL